MFVRSDCYGANLSHHFGVAESATNQATDKPCVVAKWLPTGLGIGSALLRCVSTAPLIIRPAAAGCKRCSAAFHNKPASSAGLRSPRLGSTHRTARRSCLTHAVRSPSRYRLMAFKTVSLSRAAASVTTRLEASAQRTEKISSPGLLIWSAPPSRRRNDKESPGFMISNHSAA